MVLLSWQSSEAASCLPKLGSSRGHIPRTSWRSSLSHCSYMRDAPLCKHFQGRRFHKPSGPGPAVHTAHPLYVFLALGPSPDLTLEHVPSFRVKGCELRLGAFVVPPRDRLFSLYGVLGPLKNLVSDFGLFFFPRKKKITQIHIPTSQILQDSSSFRKVGT